MKRIIILIISLMMILSVGCRKKPEAQPVSTADTPKLVNYNPTQPEPSPVKEDPVKVAPTPTVTTTTTKQATTTTVTPATTEPAPTQPNLQAVYRLLGVDPSKTIKNNPKYKVTLSNLNPKVGDNVVIKMETNEVANIVLACGIVYGNGNMHGGGTTTDSDDKKTYTCPFVVQNQPTFSDGTIQVYVIVTNHDDKTFSEYKFTLTIQK